MAFPFLSFSGSVSQDPVVMCICKGRGKGKIVVSVSHLRRLCMMICVLMIKSTTILASTPHVPACYTTDSHHDYQVLLFSACVCVDTDR